MHTKRHSLAAYFIVKDKGKLTKTGTWTPVIRRGFEIVSTCLPWNPAQGDLRSPSATITWPSPFCVIYNVKLFIFHKNNFLYKIFFKYFFTVHSIALKYSC